MMIVHQWLSPGKLNLFLYVTGRRYDGYHLLQTLFQLIDYGDIIEVVSTNTGKIRLFNLVNHFPCNNNLIIKAAKLLQHYCRLSSKRMGADIFINKLLPMGSGLGGLSSNIATVLLALNQQWQCGLNRGTLMRLGLTLGADVPVFIFGHTAIAEGIGEILKPIFLPEKWYLIIIPPVYVSTAWVFYMYKKLCYSYSPYRSVRELFVIPFHNDLESIVKRIFPEIAMYFIQLSQYMSVRLTGTGSCIFSEFDTKDLADYIRGSLPIWIKSIVTKGINISPMYNNQKLLY